MRSDNSRTHKGLKYTSGMDVEVNLDEENPNDDWFPAIFLQELDFNSFLVEYNNSTDKNKSGNVKVRVDSFHIRPPPPKLEVEQFELLEKVNAFYDSAWRLGSITKILTERRYTVFLKHGKHGKQEDEFSHSDIRPHMDFMDGQWVCYSKHKRKTASDTQAPMEHANNIAESLKVGIQIEYSSATKEKIEQESSYENSSKNPVEKSSPPDNVPTLPHPPKKSRREISTQARYIKSMLNEKPNQEAQPTMSTLAKYSDNHFICSKLSIENEDIFKGTNDEESVAKNSVEEGKLPPNSPVKSQPVLGAGENIIKGHSTKDIVEHETKEIDSSVLLAEGVRGFLWENSCQLSNKDPLSTAYCPEQPGYGNNAVRSPDAFNQVECSSSSKGDIKEVIAAVVETSCRTSSGGQPLSLRSEGYSSSKNVKQFMEDTDMSERPTMPFVKDSPVWEKVESLEVFQRMPQNPHFHPLFKCKEVDREGFAIAKMVTFANVVERISKLQCHSSLDFFYRYLDAFTDLQVHGFDVEAVVCCINELLSIKERRAHLDSLSKEVKIQISEHTAERTKLERDIEVIDEKISDLKETRALHISVKERKDSEITALQMRSGAVSACILKTACDFESLAAAPW